MSDFNEWNATIIAEFRANEGRVGGQFEGSSVLVLHSTGAKTGLERVNPVMYLDEDSHLYVFASKAGADTHPDWYFNLLHNPDVSLEIGTETVPAVARVVEEPERTRVYAIQASRLPNFAEYQANTTRVIPVVELVR